ncbi:MAG: MbnP family protein [Bacteroidota bacterium]|nr:MbnP family protein [Bacteroidota bacterium]
MRKFTSIQFLGLCLVSIISFSSCDKQTIEPIINPVVIEQNFTIKFTTVNSSSNTLALGQQTALGAFDLDFNFNTLSFYLNNIKAVKDDGTEVMVKDLILVNVNPKSWMNTDSTAVNSSFTFSLPSGNYTGLKMVLGVPAELDGDNAPLATSYPDNNPLSDKRGTWWSWDNTFRHLTVMGNAYKVGNSTPYPYSYHLRTDVVTQSFSLNKNFTLTNIAATTLTAEVNMNNVFTQPGNQLDIYKDNISDSKSDDQNQVRIVKLVADNFTKSITLK